MQELLFPPDEFCKGQWNGSIAHILCKLIIISAVMILISIVVSWNIPEKLVLTNKIYKKTNKQHNRNNKKKLIKGTNSFISN